MSWAGHGSSPASHYHRLLQEQREQHRREMQYAHQQLHGLPHTPVVHHGLPHTPIAHHGQPAQGALPDPPCGGVTTADRDDTKGCVVSFLYQALLTECGVDTTTPAPGMMEVEIEKGADGVVGISYIGRLINTVLGNSPASTAGLSEGMQIISVNRRPVLDCSFDIADAIREAPDRFKMVVMSGKPAGPAGSPPPKPRTPNPTPPEPPQPTPVRPVDKDSDKWFKSPQPLITMHWSRKAEPPTPRSPTPAPPSPTPYPPATPLSRDDARLREAGWRVAVDPQSSDEYWYNTVTKEVQWDTPTKDQLQPIPRQATPCETRGSTPHNPPLVRTSTPDRGEVAAREFFSSPTYAVIEDGVLVPIQPPHSLVTPLHHPHSASPRATTPSRSGPEASAAKATHESLREQLVEKRREIVDLRAQVSKLMASGRLIDQMQGDISELQTRLKEKEQMEDELLQALEMESTDSSHPGSDLIDQIAGRGELDQVLASKGGISTKKANKLAERILDHNVGQMSEEEQKNILKILASRALAQHIRSSPIRRMQAQHKLRRNSRFLPGGRQNMALQPERTHTAPELAAMWRASDAALRRTQQERSKLSQGRDIPPRAFPPDPIPEASPVDESSARRGGHPYLFVYKYGSSTTPTTQSSTTKTSSSSMVSELPPPTPPPPVMKPPAPPHPPPPLEMTSKLPQYHYQYSDDQLAGSREDMHREDMYSEPDHHMSNSLEASQYRDGKG